VTRWGLIGLLVLSIAACVSRSEQRLQAVFDSSAAQLWRGELANASRTASEGLSLTADNPGSTWAWRFKLLVAEIRLIGRELPEAAAILNESSPESAGPWIATKHRYLQGQLALLRGKPDEARAILDDAAQLAKRTAAEDVSLEVETMKGQALIIQRNWQEAEAILSETIGRAKERGDHYREAVALVNLGGAYLFRNRFDRALQFFETVLADKSLEQQLVYTVALTNAGICYQRLGELSRAIDAQRRAVAAHQRPGRPRFFHQAALGELGSTYLVNGDATNASKYLREAIDVATKAGLNAQASLWAANLANLHIQRGEWQQAETVNAEATRLGGDRPDLRAGIAGEIALGQGRLDEASHQFNEALALAKDRPAMQWSLYEGLGRTAAAAKKPAEAERHFEATLGVIERTQSDLLKADYRLSFLTRLLGFYQHYIDLLVDQRDADRALAIADSSRGRVLAERQNVSAPTRVTPGDLRRVAAQLDAVLLFYWIGDRSYAWQVTRNRIRLVPLSVNAAQVDALVKSYQQSIVASLADPVNGASAPGDEIFATLIAPVAGGIPAGARVVIVPDGALTRINFESLPVPGPTRHYWIEDVEVAVAPSLGTLSARVAPRGRKQSDSVLLIGDPVSSDPSFPQLRYASAEMSAVSKAFAGRTAVYSAAQATPARYRDAMPEQFGVVHFTAHAAANAESPLDSAVILSKDGSGYKLYARDVAEQPLSAGLVTISACRSAGERTYAGEGLVGFAWAFLRAGAQRVIAGLWDVDDRSTADLMGHVYAEIAQGRTPSAALRNAKLAMIARGGAAAKPYYWAPFQLFIGSRVTP
jgi:CHAT domain-containing protein/predicted negative regulator of RcsB-dependent stress response